MWRTALKVYAVVVLFGFVAEFAQMIPAEAKGGGGSSYSSAPSSGGRSYSSPSYSSSPRPSYSPAPSSAPTVRPAPSAPKPSYSPAPAGTASQRAGERDRTVYRDRTTVIHTSPGGGGFFSTMLGVMTGMWLFQSCNQQQRQQSG